MKKFSLLRRSGSLAFLTITLALFAPTAFSSDLTRIEGAPVISTKAEAAVFWRSVSPDIGNTTNVIFAPLPESALKTLQEENSSDNGLRAKALKIGINRGVDTEAFTATPFVSNWQNIGDGHVARLAVTSPEARGMRVALKLHMLPDAAELRFSGSNAPERIIGVISGKEANALRDDHKVYWTPVTEGETQNMEIFLPLDIRTEDVKVRLNAVSHLFTSAQDGFSAAPVVKASQLCEVDVACKSGSLGTGFQNASRAVARMTYTKSGSSYTCTGTLLNSTSGAPYFWGAAHCISTQSVANTLNTYWFYERTSCGSSPLNSNYRQLSGGAQLLHAKTSTDTLLLRLNNAAPAGAYLAGWDADPFSSGAMIGIHHPAGDVKKVSIGKGEGRTCNTLFGSDPTLNMSSLTLVSWSEGSTEGGSSGSGLFTLSGGVYYLRGGLQGGAASCYNTGQPVNSGNADCYSRLSLVYSEVQQWLTSTAAPVPVISSATLPTGTVNSTYPSTALKATNNPTSWAITTGRLPNGLAFNTSTGVISGTPTETGVFSFAVIASNASGASSAVSFSITIAGGTPTYGPTRQYTGQWAKVNASGVRDEHNWGLSVLMYFPNNARYIFVPWYTYDSSGKASWYIFQGDVWSANDVISMDVYRYTGSPWGVMPYDNSRITSTKVGTASLTFTSAMDATFSYNVEGSSRTIQLAKLDGVNDPQPPLQYSGQWARAGENNWGLSVLMNFPYNTKYVFVPWYTYDASGKALWYIFQGNISGNTLSADVYRYTGSSWGTVPYDNNRISNAVVGTATLTFTSATEATFSYNVEGSSRTITLTKLQ